MTYQGQVKNGVIVFGNQPPLPEGTRVRIEPVTTESAMPSTDGEPNIWRELQTLAGAASGLPTDVPERHDHYRRQRRGM
jgi:hypothetical protein